MEKLDEFFRVSLKNKNMEAYIDCVAAKEIIAEEVINTKEEWQGFLNKHGVTYGVLSDVIEKLATEPEELNYPVLVAKGLEAVHGTDGKITYMVQFEEEIKRNENWDFRDVMKIPSVKKADTLAKIIAPTSGEDGRTVKNELVKARPGRRAVYRAGQNVKFSESEATFHATESGQFNVANKRLHVLPEFQVNETLSLKSGNLDFVGTIIIRGDVPTGFTVKADGDVKIYGLVENATIVAGGSIYITEGISGQGKGVLKAGEDIKVGYINQAIVSAGQDLYVENSILHSVCTVRGHVYSQKGNIIGGSVSAGKTIEAHDIGTRWNTKTEIIFGLDKTIMEEEEQLIKEKEKLTDMLTKLKLLGDKLQGQDSENPKVRISRLRQQHSYIKTEEKLADIAVQLEELNASLGDITECKLTVRNFIYQNVHVSFGKYQRSINHDYHYIEMRIEDNEIALQQLYN